MIVSLGQELLWQERLKNHTPLLAGNPAKVVKTGISWDSLRPMRYQEKFQHNDKLKH